MSASEFEHANCVNDSNCYVSTCVFNFDKTIKFGAFLIVITKTKNIGAINKQIKVLNLSSQDSDMVIGKMLIRWKSGVGIVGLWGSTEGDRRG